VSNVSSIPFITHVNMLKPHIFSLKLKVQSCLIENECNYLVLNFIVKI
jgi:hypothetical protein